MTAADNFPALLDRLITARFGPKGKSAFAEAMGVHRPVISQWMKERQPKLDTLVRMAEVLGCPLEILQAPFIASVHSDESENSMNANEPSTVRETGLPYGSENLTNERMVKLQSSAPKPSKKQARAEQASREIEARLLAFDRASPAERKVLKMEIVNRVEEYERYVDLDPDKGTI
jgi:transcriptional regulator with XRE-family HTH domain